MNRIFRAARAKLSSQSGINTIEVVLILVIIIALVLVFKSQISGILDGIFVNIRSSINSVY